MTSALIDLIRPIPYAGVVRPYLPMQSTSLSADVSLLDPSTAPGHFILGITNPFLLQRIASSATREPPYILVLNARAPTARPDSSLAKSASLSRRATKLATTRIDVPGTPIHTPAKPSPPPQTRPRLPQQHLCRC